MTIRQTATVLGTALAITTGFSVPAFASPAGPPIIGGHTVTDAPWAASVYQSGNFACSGTIIAPTWVLTAKHCTKSNSITARVGSPYRSRATEIRVSQVKVSPNSDLALLQLEKPFQTTYSQLADADPAANSTNQICGWGRTSYNGSASDQLKCADVRVTSTTCTDNDGARALCSTKGTGNAWKGDSGGPEFFNNHQVGVASTADGRSKQTYASVTVSRSWIRSTAGV
ncbi:DUF1986 domain-containing protein [Actinomadura barringtoniae]|uniref:DUF1986 domain-containing protein n=1 Tax=Actinomadura barringtoniae TaxID=1427535 RepID=A0A939T9Q4_9ACTN|nr:DUF1986 domain-containing protein [Actinomadura barringtoniae]MBO2454524.1 DUF1986 domain-containing protein [Actinomadura barringtoniae]